MAKKKRQTRARVVKPVGIIPGQPAGKHRPFKSKAQWRLFFANPRLRKYAIGKAHATGGHSSVTKTLGFSPAYRRLPGRKGASIKRLPLKGSKQKSKR